MSSKSENQSGLVLERGDYYCRKCGYVDKRERFVVTRKSARNTNTNPGELVCPLCKFRQVFAETDEVAPEKLFKKKIHGPYGRNNLWI